MGGFIDMDKICHPFSRPFPRDPDKRNIKKRNPCIVLIGICRVGDDEACWNGRTLFNPHRDVSFWHNPCKRGPYYQRKVMKVHCWEFQCSTLSSCFSGREFMGNVRHFYDIKLEFYVIKYFSLLNKTLIISKKAFVNVCWTAPVKPEWFV